MDFQNVNLLNVRLNLVSGNLLPMIVDSPFSFFWKTYSAFVWTSQFILGIVMVLGCVYVPIEKALKDGLICFVVFIEMFFMVLRIHARNDLMYQLIQKLNAILRTTDETMKSVMTATLEPVKIPLNFYWSTGLVSIIAWYFVPFLLAFKKNVFCYEDYRVPAVFSNQPFSVVVFLLGSLFILVSNTYMFLKKVGVTVYTVHLILMVTAQYRYIALKITMLFQDGNEHDESQKKHSPEFYRKKENEMRTLCRLHNDVVH